jgi:hypothetical protein
MMMPWACFCCGSRQDCDHREIELVVFVRQNNREQFAIERAQTAIERAAARIEAVADRKPPQSADEVQTELVEPKLRKLG